MRLSNVGCWSACGSAMAVLGMEALRSVAICPQLYGILPRPARGRSICRLHGKLGAPKVGCWPLGGSFVQNQKKSPPGGVFADHDGRPDMAKEFTGEWREWVRHNLQRGCSRNDLFTILLEEGFRYDVIESEFVLGGVRLCGTDVPLYLVEGFLTETECTRLVELVKGSLRRST